MLTNILNGDDIKYLIDILNSSQTLEDIYKLFTKFYFFQRVQYNEILYFLINNDMLSISQQNLAIFIIYYNSLDSDYKFLTNFIVDILDNINNNKFLNFIKNLLENKVNLKKDIIFNENLLNDNEIDKMFLKNKLLDLNKGIKFNPINKNLDKYFIINENKKLDSIMDVFFDIEYLNEWIRLLPDQVPNNLELSIIRPLPEEVPIFDEEIKFLMPISFDYPLMISDLDEKLMFIQLIQKASSQNLNAQENKLLTQIICFNINLLDQEIMKRYLPGMVEYNIFLVSRILFKWVNLNQALFKTVLTMFIQDIKMSIHSLEIIFNLLQGIYLPQEFLDCYINEWFKYCYNLSNDPKQQQRKLKLITKFVSHLVEKKLFDPVICFEIWVKFWTDFENHKCAKDLHKILKLSCSN